MDIIGESFFELLLDDRVCEDIGILEFYCFCLSLRFIDIVYVYVYWVGKVVVKYINDILMFCLILVRFCY